jgi:two-component system NtrC family sensor kinase
LLNGEESNFFGPIIYTYRVDQLLYVWDADMSSPEDALLEVALQGATSGPHRVKVFFNDAEVGEVSFSGQSQARFLAGLIALGGVMLIMIGAYFTTRAMMKELQRMDREKAASDEVAMQSSKMAALGKMAAGIAHEINNPLAVIGEKAGWMKDLLGMEEVAQSENFQELSDAVTKIEYHVVRAKTVTHRLLGFARRMEPMAERINVNEILDESIEFLKNEARYRSIEIQANYAPDLPLTTTDQSQLQQVFLNIINNAIDAIGKDGEININTRTTKRNNEISVEISDNGPGMPKDVLQKIFDPFFTTKEVGKGTGLGLSISYSIIEKLGGRIMVASEAGQGTTFTIYLPVR